MIESARNTSRRRRQVWLARMRQRDACWVGWVSLTVSLPMLLSCPCGIVCSRIERSGLARDCFVLLIGAVPSVKCVQKTSDCDLLCLFVDTQLHWDLYIYLLSRLKDAKNLITNKFFII